MTDHWSADKSQFTSQLNTIYLSINRWKKKWKNERVVKVKGGRKKNTTRKLQINVKVQSTKYKSPKNKNSFTFQFISCFYCFIPLWHFHHLFCYQLHDRFNKKKKDRKCDIRLCIFVNWTCELLVYHKTNCCIEWNTYYFSIW